MNFLAPTEQEKRELAAEAERKGIQAAKAKKLAAAERKRKREDDAARVAVITEALKETRDRKVVARERKENKERDETIAAWLDTGRYFGTSTYTNKDLVKQLCGEAGERIYDPETKMFGTKILEFLPRLVRSFVWVPAGLPAHWVDAMLVEASKRADDKLLKTEAVSMVKRENAEEEANAGPVQTIDEREDAIRRRGMVQAPTIQELEKARALGFTEAAIDESPRFPDLGPTSGLSTEARLVRFVEAKAYAARSAFEFSGTSERHIQGEECLARALTVRALNNRAKASAKVRHAATAAAAVAGRKAH